MNNTEIMFKPTIEGWERGKDWAKKQPSPSGVQEDLWEWASNQSTDSYEVLMLINKEYKKING